MNYIILNGKKSDLIQGLLIQYLPPISKPLIRTQTDEIDGRDGDIVTKLGYSAYDKEISIGLHGSFSVDEVIAYFDSEGIVTFSNEPDKYYRYQIIQQIDFEKLIRYRTATVVMHCQPFKFSLTERAKAQIITPSVTEMVVYNSGNTFSKPKLTITGSGSIGISLNGYQMFTIALADEGYITIDTDAMEAYKGDSLKNRLVNGDYDNFKLSVGRNVITWTGTVTEISIEKYSRWI